jgi:hypothetical protein
VVVGLFHNARQANRRSLVMAGCHSKARTRENRPDSEGRVTNTSLAGIEVFAIERPRPTL